MWKHLWKHFFLLTDLLESSLRLKPYEAQKYRKRALWVSWISIIITLILAVAAFSEYFTYIIFTLNCSTASKHSTQ